MFLDLYAGLKYIIHFIARNLTFLMTCSQLYRNKTLGKLFLSLSLLYYVLFTFSLLSSAQLSSSWDSSFIPAMGWKMMSVMLMHLQPVEKCYWYQFMKSFSLIELREMNSWESQSSWRRGGSFNSPLTNNHGFIGVKRWSHWLSIIFHVCSMFRQSCSQAELVHVYGFSPSFLI